MNGRPKGGRRKIGMKAAGMSLSISSMIAGACPALAKAPSHAAPAPTPVGSPGDWIGTEDYPAAALRFQMTGVTGVRLAVDVSGQPTRCDIVQSSGFDLLDTATCQRLMTRARFSPLRNRKGKPVESSYSSRVRWQLPEGARLPVTDRFVSTLMSIDRAGKVTSCRLVIHFPTDPRLPAENPCDGKLKSPPPAFGLELRGASQDESAEIEVQMADVFMPTLRERVLSPVPGYEQRALNVHRLTILKGGKLGQCSYEEQRGSGLLATDICGEARDQVFDPPFSAFDKDGVATGWHITRVLLKTGK